MTRKLYRAVGVPAIAPVDAALGLPEEKYTLEVRRIVAAESAKSSFDEMVLSFDGKGIAMRPDDLRAATRKAAEETPRTLHSRLAKGEKPNRKRMAQVAAIYSLPLWRRTIADVLHGLHDPKERDAKQARYSWIPDKISPTYTDTGNGSHWPASQYRHDSSPSVSRTCGFSSIS